MNVSMSKRKTSRMIFTYGVITALALTGIILFVLIAGWSFRQAIWLTVGVLVVVWTIIFSFMETHRIAAHSKSITGPKDLVDPDAPRELIVEPPTGEPEEHHEFHKGSPGLDQGQLTSRLPDQLPLPRKLRESDSGTKRAS